MKKINLFMTFLIVLMLITGCSNSSNPTEKLQVSLLEENKVISTEGFHTYQVQIEKEENVTIENVYLYLNMKMMNHPIEGTMSKVDEGIYELDLPLAMSGEWYANITVTADGEAFVFEDYEFKAEGPKQIEWMKGYNADIN